MKKTLKMENYKEYKHYALTNNFSELTEACFAFVLNNFT